MRNLNWPQIKSLSTKLIARKSLPEEYASRLEFELKEIERQDAIQYWVSKINEDTKYETNNNGLVLPWLFKLTPVDPLTTNHKISLSTDLPDIDMDCLPKARDALKEYVKQKYGDQYTCSVGTWLTYKLKSAIQDVCRALGGNLAEAMALTKKLPEDVDDLMDGGYSTCVSCKTLHNGTECPKCGSHDTNHVTIGKLLHDYEDLKAYNEQHSDIVENAVKLVGKIKSMGKHAGGVIISNTELMGNVPLGISKSLDGTPQWLSMWTEGRSPQLSKLGFTKWDILGLKTLQYIHEACKLIEQTRGYKFNTIPWQDNDPTSKTLGWYLDENGLKHEIRMDDEQVYKMLNELKVESVFQFETDIQRQVLSNGVRDYYDLQVMNAMGHPGPIDSIPEYIQRRDDKDKKWLQKEHPDVAKELEDTYGLVIYQEQLANIWRKFAGFTAVEAESARKAVAKKWTDKLKAIEGKWIEGASKTIGEEWAQHYWNIFVDFARYAFNKCIPADAILEDPTTGDKTTPAKLHKRPEPFKLTSIDDNNVPFPNEILETIDTGVNEVYDIEFSNGIHEQATLNHKYKCEDGTFRTVQEIFSNNYKVIIPPNNKSSHPPCP